MSSKLWTWSVPRASPPLLARSVFILTTVIHLSDYISCLHPSSVSPLPTSTLVINSFLAPMLTCTFCSGFLMPSFKYPFAKPYKSNSRVIDLYWHPVWANVLHTSQHSSSKPLKTTTSHERLLWFSKFGNTTALGNHPSQESTRHCLKWVWFHIFSHLTFTIGPCWSSRNENHLKGPSWIEHTTTQFLSHASVPTCPTNCSSCVWHFAALVSTQYTSH